LTPLCAKILTPKGGATILRQIGAPAHKSSIACSVLGQRALNLCANSLTLRKIAPAWGSVHCFRAALAQFWCSVHTFGASIL
jgi:hypothetical protein